MRRLEAALGTGPLNRTTCSIALTKAGARLLAHLNTAPAGVDDALQVVKSRRDRIVGTLRLNVPFSVARLVLASIVPAFLAA